MLDSFYTAIFRPASEIRSPIQTAIVIGLLVVLIMALNAAGAAGLGVGGIIGFGVLFLFAGSLGWYWLGASLNLVAQLFGGQGNGRDSLSAIAHGLWPLLLTGVAIAASQWSQTLGAVFSVAITVGVLGTLAIAIHRVHQLSWLSSILCVAITFSLSFLALFGLILWPLMIILGT